MKKERFKIVPASYLFLVKEDEILLQRRFNTGYEDGRYSVPAGHVEAGENFTQCIIRESKEEIGIVLEAKNLKVCHVMCRNSGTAENSERVDVFFIAEEWKGNIENKEPEKCDDLQWFNLNSLPENIIPYVKQAISCIKSKTFYSEVGYADKK